jgi:hypothetical protein
MPTESSARAMAFAPVDGRRVVADFAGGAITSNAGALLLGATDRAIGLIERFAGCFVDSHAGGRVVHDVSTLVGQRVLGIALSDEDLVDHDQLRHDPVLARERGADCAPAGGGGPACRVPRNGSALATAAMSGTGSTRLKIW